MNCNNINFKLNNVNAKYDILSIVLIIIVGLSVFLKLKIPSETKLVFLLALILLISVYNIYIAICLLVVGIIFIVVQNNNSIDSFTNDNIPCRNLNPSNEIYHCESIKEVKIVQLMI